MRNAATAPIIESLPSMKLSPSRGDMAATNKCLAQSNKSRASGKATKNLLALTAAPPLLDGVNLPGCAINLPKGTNRCRFASDDRAGRHGKLSRSRSSTGSGRPCADCLDRYFRRFWHDSGGHVVVAVIVPQPRVPSRLNRPRLFATGSASFRSSA
jgi:hypothetical protein